jgi:hypothetical protein
MIGTNCRAETGRWLNLIGERKASLGRQLSTGSLQTDASGKTVISGPLLVQILNNSTVITSVVPIERPDKDRQAKSRLITCLQYMSNP